MVRKKPKDRFKNKVGKKVYNYQKATIILSARREKIHNCN